MEEPRSIHMGCYPMHIWLQPYSTSNHTNDANTIKEEQFASFSSTTQEPGSLTKRMAPSVGQTYSAPHSLTASQPVH